MGRCTAAVHCTVFGSQMSPPVGSFCNALVSYYDLVCIACWMQILQVYNLHHFRQNWLHWAFMEIKPQNAAETLRKLFLIWKETGTSIWTAKMLRFILWSMSRVLCDSRLDSTWAGPAFGTRWSRAAAVRISTLYRIGFIIIFEKHVFREQVGSYLYREYMNSIVLPKYQHCDFCLKEGYLLGNGALLGQLYFKVHFFYFVHQTYFTFDGSYLFWSDYTAANINTTHCTGSEYS